MKKTLLVLILVFPCLTFSQSKKITLSEAINLAQKQSPDYKTTLNRNQSNYWRFRNYKASFLPQLRFNATLPEYNKAVRRITNDAGQDVFVNQDQLLLEGGLSIAQNIPYTGGTLSLNSNLERIELFGLDDNIGYSVVPFSIRYFQNSLFYNPFKWDKKIEPLIYEESRRDFIEKMEDISVTTCQRYFQLLKAQMQLEIAKVNLSNQDTLYQISQGRFKIGKIAENELLQVELTLLNSRNIVTTNTIELKRTSQNLARYLELETENIQLDVPDKLPLFEVDIDKALEEAQSNRKTVIEFRRKRLEAEKELAFQKGNNRVRLGVAANFGISQNGDDFDNLFNNFNKQQNVSVSLSIPVFDWGVSKSRRKMAEADLDLTNNNIDQEKQAFEQEIYLHVLNWSNQRDFLATAEKAKEIAIRRYDISQKRYVLDKITITDLNIALQEKDKAVLQYLNSLEKFWQDYYILRQLTLYDFINDKKLEVDTILFD
ncbi:Outer membrane efflux protein [Mariniflexile rhizosphaerae]|uniref:TolC family protein n=1 Tax=unclassified Mariniflexile TaxID=2643887 RepID=UPI000CC3C5DC|nr:TolC family protein [Mariniflexile sp. TRM1-10]AXP79127.1 Outer membrane efflux protein [Mariniflexile sp. TRM1-10]PLB18699.1 MAG: putative outer membrane protein TolC [Flavobacteriaceae bacterium FS1-H7996/R]